LSGKTNNGDFKMKRMKSMKFMLVGLVMALALGLTGVVMAADDATGPQYVNITFSEMAVIAATGSADIIIVAPEHAGDLPADTPNSASSSTLAWTSSVVASGANKITASLGTVFSNIDLWVKASAPGLTQGITVAGALTGDFTGYVKLVAGGELNVNAVDCVTGIENCNVADQPLDYIAHVTGMLAADDYQQVVTWTITEEE
jgi:hypothetical protein